MRKWISGLFGRGGSARGSGAAAPAPGSGPTLVQRGFERQRAGDPKAAGDLYRQALAEDPDNADASYLLATIASAGGDHAAALGLFERAIAADPSDANYHLGLAGELRLAGRIEESLAAFEAAIERDPDDPDWLNDYGNTLRLAGRGVDAIEAYGRALRLRPDFSDARYNLGSALYDRGDLEAAAAALEGVVAADPAHADARNNLGLVRFQQGRLDEALDLFAQAIARHPGHARALNNIGLVRQRRGEYAEAIASYERALSTAPDYADAAGNLGLALQEIGRPRDAIARYARALKGAAKDGLRIRQATVLPVIPESNEEIRGMRERFDREVSALLQRPLAVADPVSEVGSCNFHLAYHGEDDRPLQTKAAALHEHACPALLFTAPHCRARRAPGGKIKVGFVTKFLYDHSIGRTTRGLVAKLSRDRFETFALFVPPFVDDPISRFIRDRAGRHLLLSPQLEAARRQIAELELDVLFFQEIGMDPFTYFLAFARLAPVQCVSFGHPDTTGITNMDYFVSTDSFEPEGAQAHYSERLVELEDLGSLAYYYRPELTSPVRDRAGFGLAEDRNLYLCPQTLFKLHPEFDALLAGILRADPRGELLLIRGRAPEWTALAQQRFARTMPDVLDRITFLPGSSPQEFLGLIAACDVMLDTIHFNGMNTSLEAFAVGTPVVTLPKRFQRGRHTYGMYKRMGIMDAVAADEEEYVALALRYGTDRGERAALAARILAGNDVLYEDLNVVRGFERFFTEACAKETPQGGGRRR